MTFATVTLLALFGLTALNWTIHFYTQVVTYRLFGSIAAVAGGDGFVRYHQAYQRALPWSIYLPWSVLVAASLAHLAAAPGIAGATLAALNLSIAPISVLLAVPAHRRIDRTATLSPDDERLLLRANLVRLIVASASLVLVSVLAVTALR